jgi:hypothetical protein
MICAELLISGMSQFGEERWAEASSYYHESKQAELLRVASMAIIPRVI